ncbi:MAG TPA: S24 family peptidase [Rhodopseudomonas sp.]|uniref:XRE family transcriptional regulator n=1 Tax=Rhodopseudomonas sp. TaxID=1078 RepID=UPI002ED7920E
MKRAIPANKAKRTHPALETIKARVQERINAANISRNEASRRAGLGLSYVNDLLADRSKDPSRESLAKLGTILDTDAAYFFGEQDTPRLIGPSEAGRSNHSAPIVGFPLYQIGLTDADGFFALNESAKSMMLSPLANVPEVYCVSVPDDTMAPRYRTGEAVIVNPKLPVKGGGFALVRQSDDRVAIREVVSISLDKISVRSLGDQTITEMPRASVKSLERIVGSCELV